MEADHLCRTHNCVRPEHVEPVTRSENNRRGIGPITIPARGAFVTAAQAAEVVRALARGHSQRAIAQQVGISQNTVGRINRGEWKEWSK